MARCISCNLCSNDDPDAFFTNGDDDILQRQWARENGMRAKPSLEDILLAQIEHHRTEVFYNLDPVRYPSAFVRKLPGLRQKDAVLAGGAVGQADLTAYGAVLGNFPSILDFWRRKGCRAELFFPAIDPVNEQIMALAIGRSTCCSLAAIPGIIPRARRRSSRSRVSPTRGRCVYCLDASRLTRLAESSLGRLLPFKSIGVRRGSQRSPSRRYLGRQLYELIGKSKIVLNGAIDMAGQDRGNMRCFEAMGCGALLVSDAGNYPEEWRRAQTMETYESPEQAAEVDCEVSRQLARIGGDGRRGTKRRFRRSTAKLRNGRWFVDLVGRI